MLFYSPLKAHVAMYYDEMIMLRFPTLFISVAAFTLISMVQYHRMALRDIDYTQRLTAEEFDVIKSHATIGGKILERSAGMRGTQFDPALLDAFVSLADDGTLDAVCAQADAQLAHAVSLGPIENPTGIA